MIEVNSILYFDSYAKSCNGGRGRVRGTTSGLYHSKFKQFHLYHRFVPLRFTQEYIHIYGLYVTFLWDAQPYSGKFSKG